MLVEFTRVATREDNVVPFSNDMPSEPVHEATEQKIMINPAYVAAVLDSARSPGNSIIKLPDGRGFLVVGTLREVVAKLTNNDQAQTTIN